MTKIKIDAVAWGQRDDFYDALLHALGAPLWHGRNLDALSDSLRGDDINSVKLPLHITITNTALIPPELLMHLKKFAELTADLRTRDRLEIKLTLQ